MSLKARIFLLSIAVTGTIISVLFVVQLSNVIDSWLAGSQEIAEVAGQQVKNLLIVRLQEHEATNDVATPEGRKQAWTNMLQGDKNFVSLLETTMAQARSIIEISIAGQQHIVIASSNPFRAGSAMPVRPELKDLRTAGPFRRILPILKGTTDYQLLVPLGLEGEPTPVFQIQVLVSSVLLRHELFPAVRRVAGWAIGALITSVLLAWLSARLALANLSKISVVLDRISSGQDPAIETAPADREFAAIESKLNLLGHRVRGVKELQANVQTVLESLEEAILLFDAENRVMLAGGAVERLLGFQADGIAGWNLQEVLPSITPMGRLANKAFASHTAVKEAAVDYVRNGDLAPLLMSIDFTRSGQEPERFTALLRVRDAAGHQELESHLGLSARLDAMNRITSSVAHEIKNPLNSIAVRLDNLQSWATNGFPQAEQEVQQIFQEVNRLDRVVRTFLDFTRPVELAQGEVDIVHLVRSVAVLYEEDARRRSIPITFSGPADPLYVLGDADLLKEAVINIVTNALEAMPEGGALSMAVAESGAHCSITITDTGAGIPEAQREKVFELYFTSKKNGSGLGLPMAFRAVQLHDGAIEVDSPTGGGTTFRLTLPIIVGVRRKP